MQFQIICCVDWASSVYLQQTAAWPLPTWQLYNPWCCFFYSHKMAAASLAPQSVTINNSYSAAQAAGTHSRGLLTPSRGPAVRTVFHPSHPFLHPAVATVACAHTPSAVEDSTWSPSLSAGLSTTSAVKLDPEHFGPWATALQVLLFLCSPCAQVPRCTVCCALSHRYPVLLVVLSLHIF